MKFIRTFVVAVGILTLSAPAFAHTTIVTSNIEDGVSLTAAPDMFEFSFGDEVGLAGLELETLAGEAVAIAFERPRQMGKDFSMPLPALETGRYVLKWRVVAKDGHVMRGEIDFTITG
jgi:hypothetical protein